jgi:hypothetical protein
MDPRLLVNRFCQHLLAAGMHRPLLCHVFIRPSSALNFSFASNAPLVLLFFFPPLLCAEQVPAEAYFDSLVRVRVTPASLRAYGPQFLDRGAWVELAQHFVLTVLTQGLQHAPISSFLSSFIHPFVFFPLSTVCEALGNRVTLVAPVRAAAPAWPVDQPAPLHGSTEVRSPFPYPCQLTDWFLPACLPACLR